jgi:hypothetical protein
MLGESGVEREAGELHGWACVILVTCRLQSIYVVIETSRFGGHSRGVIYQNRLLEIFKGSRHSVIQKISITLPCTGGVATYPQYIYLRCPIDSTI